MCLNLNQEALNSTNGVLNSTNGVLSLNDEALSLKLGVQTLDDGVWKSIHELQNSDEVALNSNIGLLSLKRDIQNSIALSHDSL